MSDSPKTVGAVMSRQVMVLSEEDNLQRVLEGMNQFHIRHVPVVDGEKLVGIVSHRDMLSMMASSIATTVHERGKEESVYERTFVVNVMTRNPITVSPSTPLKDAVALIVKHRFGALPVVDGGKLVGMLTDIDLLSELEKSLA
jgi:CBS domain-containing protein